MLKNIYQSFLLDYAFKKQLWMIIVFISLLSNLLLSIKIVTSETLEKTVIHPIGIMSSYSVKGGEADPKYIISLAEEFLSGRFLYTPKTITNQFDNLAVYFHPEIYSEKKSELDIEVERIIRNNESSAFYPMSSHAKSNTAYIKANVRGYIGKKLITDRTKIFEVVFRNSGNRIWLFSWSEVISDPSGTVYTPIDNGEF